MGISGKSSRMGAPAKWGARVVRGRRRRTRVHEPLVGHVEEERPLDDDAPEEVAGGRSGLRLPFGALGGDALEESGVVVLVDRQRHDHPGVDVASGFTGLLVMQRHGDEGAEDEIPDALPSASEQGGSRWQLPSTARR